MNRSNAVLPLKINDVFTLTGVSEEGDICYLDIPDLCQVNIVRTDEGVSVEIISTYEEEVVASTWVTESDLVGGDDIPWKVFRALMHVRKFHPEVIQVVFLRDGKWLYMDGEGNCPSFSDEVDVNILEGAAKSLDTFPSAYALS